MTLDARGAPSPARGTTLGVAQGAINEAPGAIEGALGSTLRVVFAPDSFKGSLTSVEVARSLADGWRRARPNDELSFAPLADGGEGTLTAIEFAGGWERRTSRVSDPIGRPIDAAWLLATDGSRAFVELAEASGLSPAWAGRTRPDGCLDGGHGRDAAGGARRRRRADHARDRRQCDERRRRGDPARARGGDRRRRGERQ